jgi:hypothetical protein
VRLRGGRGAACAENHQLRPHAPSRSAPERRRFARPP